MTAQNVPTVLVGHVTKDGSLAGPKVLEHVVDTVLYFEGDRHHSHRVIRAVKNRFGAVSELGVFEMTGAGLRAVPNPSRLFLSERASGTPGSAVLCCVEGSRPILVEVQALVSTSTFGNALAAVPVDGMPGDEALVGDSEVAVNGTAGAGSVTVFSTPASAPSSLMVLAQHDPEENFAYGSSVSALPFCAQATCAAAADFRRLVLVGGAARTYTYFVLGSLADPRKR